MTLDQENQNRYQNVRAAFVKKGTSFNAWCNSKKITPQNARKALLGHWTGQKASALVIEIIAAAEATL